MNIEISVIVPIYNSEKHLKKCIDSIINQTFKDIEIILIDDGSTDNSLAICRELKKDDERIIILSQMNSGPSHARNLGIKMAKGNYIIFVDSDDYIDSKMFDEMYYKMIDGKFDMVMCGYDIVDLNKTYHIKSKFFGEYYLDEKNVFLEQLYTSDYDIISSVWNKLYKKNIIDKNNILFDCSLIRAEDFWFNFSYLKNIKKVYVLDKYFYKYVQNDTSIMHDLKNTNHDTWKKTRQRLLQENISMGINIDYNEFYRAYINKHILYFKQLVKTDNWKIINEIVEDDFFVNSLKYIGKLPFHIKIICYLLKSKQLKLVKLIFFMWNIVH